jgi:ribosomal-protein-alanine N-acetyltransferase
MLSGERVTLRPVREADLPAFIAAHVNVRNRGAYFPLGVISEPVLRRRYADPGFWEREEGTLLSWSRDEEIVGHATKKQHRIHLVIVPGNEASVRSAKKCGFVHEGTVRGAFFNAGRNHDVHLYSLLRTDPRPWHAAADVPADVPSSPLK